MSKYLLILFCLLPVSDAIAQRGGRGGGNRMYEVMEKLKNPDQNNDYEVSSSELRSWLDLFIKVYTESRRMGRVDLVILEDIARFDENDDSKFSSKEKKKARDYFKELFDKASEKINEEFDKNNNRRLDKSELAEVNSELDGLLRYVIANKKELTRKEDDPNAKRAIDDLYD